MDNNPESNNYMEHIFKMRKLTKDELVNLYWDNANDIERDGEIYFIIRGSIKWQSEFKNPIYDDKKKIWLKSDYYDPVGKSINKESIKNYLQWNLNLYDVIGGMKININLNDAEGSKYEIEDSIRDISLITNVFSLLYQGSVLWYPARRIKVEVQNKQHRQNTTESTSEEWRFFPIPRSQQEASSSGINDVHIMEDVYQIVNKIKSINNYKIQSIIRTAINWHAQANIRPAGLNRFLNYWESIELLGHFFFDKLPMDMTKKDSKSEKRLKIKNKLNEIDDSNCLKTIEECIKIMKPTARIKIECLIRVLFDEEDVQIELIDTLFKKRPEIKMSYKDIRDSIAHGNFSENNREFVVMVNDNIYEMYKSSAKIILNLIKKSEELSSII
jgi:hypothetical protein